MNIEVIIAKVIAYELVMCERYRNKIGRLIQGDEWDYVKYNPKTLQAEIDALIEIKVPNFTEEFGVRLYQALQHGLEQFGIYTRADGDRLFVKQEIVEVA